MQESQCRGSELAKDIQFGEYDVVSSNRADRREGAPDKYGPVKKPRY